MDFRVVFWIDELVACYKYAISTHILLWKQLVDEARLFVNNG